ncbi:MAG: phage tail tube protein [Parvibaculaceae bacterium]|nr:phage tail tube protein [Parvibaculaceae bacterium]
MAQPKTMTGNKMTIALGDGATAEEFNAFCGINAKTVNFQTNTNEDFVYDCDDTDSPPWRELTKSGRFVSITGSGQLDTSVLARYQEAYDSDEAVNAQVILDVLAANGGGYWEGAFMFTQFNITGNNGEKVQVEISLESDGAVTWVDAS